MDSRDIEKETRDRLAWTDLLEHLALRCHSPRAQALARAMPRIDDIDTLEATLDQVVEARDLHARSERPPFGEVHDLRPALAHLTKDGALDAETLLITAETLRSLDRLARFLQAQETHAPRLAALASRIQDLESVWGAIDDAFNPSGNLADHASHELHDRRRQVSRLKGQLGHEMKRLMDTPQIARHLQDRFITTRDDRLVLPVRADAIGAVDGIVLGSSSSGATLFVAPRELVGLNNQLKVAEFAVQQEELRILRDLSQLVAEERDTIATNSEVGVQLDLLDGRARLAIDLDAERPRLSREGHLHLRAARHPLLALSRIDVVPNDITLDAGRGLIISGPNAGGKTVCLKTAGLLALMVRAGMLLPVAPDSEIPIYRRVLAEIGDAQSIERDLSSFTAHVAQLLHFIALLDADTLAAAAEAQAPDHAPPQALVLIDEIVTGTDPRQGEALARALLGELVDRAGQLIVTTHYEGLKALPTHDPRFVNANVGFDLDQMQPTFTLDIGAPGTSFALAVARKLGLEERVAIQAESYLAQAEHDLANLLADLAQQRTALIKAQDDAQKERAQATEERRRYERKLRDLKEKGQKAHTTAHTTALTELKHARAELTRARKQVRQAKKLDAEKLHHLDRQVSSAARTVNTHEPKPEAPETRASTQTDLAVGQEVFVRRLGGRATIQTPPRRGRVEVLFGRMRTLVSVDEIALPKQPSPSKRSSKPAIDPHVRSPKIAPSTGRSADNTLDLRGQRVDDALRAFDDFIDQALLEGRDLVYVLHGRGTFALRRAIREQADASPVIASHREADRDDGGDAVTLIELR